MDNLMYYCCQVISALDKIIREKGFVNKRYTISPGLGSLTVDYWCFNSTKGLAEFGVLKVSNHKISGNDRNLIERILTITSQNEKIYEIMHGFENSESEKDYESVYDF